MNQAPTLHKVKTSGIDQLWYTRCNVPTGSGIAYDRGWLRDAFAPDGIEIGILQDAPIEIARHHYDHGLAGLIREGGNVPALVARSQGAPTRLVGLTWIDEYQVIAVRGDSDIGSAADLKGSRFAVPALTSRRTTNMARAMAIHGARNALRLTGLSLADIRLVDIPLEEPGGEIIPPGRLREKASIKRWPGLDLVASGGADAVYLKGAAAAEAAKALGLRIAVNLDGTPDLRSRVNNGTPRPITVHQQLLDERPDWVVAFLAATLRASDWAASHPAEVRSILARETGSGTDGVETAYGPEFYKSLHPNLSRERLELLDIQKAFLLEHGFIERDFDLGDWVDFQPLKAAARAKERRSRSQVIR